MQNLSDKTNLLFQITEAVKAKLVTKEDLMEAFYKGNGEEKPTNNSNTLFDFSKFLSFIGAGIVFCGVIFLVSIYWQDLGDVGQVLITLGGGITAFIMANFLHYGLNRKFTSASFHLIGGALIPIGIFVWLSKLPSSNIEISLVTAIVFAVLSLIYIITEQFIKSNLLTLLFTFYGSICYWSLYTFILTSVDFEALNRYRLTSVAGIVFSVCLLGVGYFYENSVKKLAGNIIFNVGFFSLLGFVFSLVIDYAWAEALYSLVLIGGIFLATKMKSSWVLTIDTFYILGYIFYLNARYFVNVVGWPLSLIFGGLLIISLSYFAVDLNKKYIKK